MQHLCQIAQPSQDAFGKLGLCAAQNLLPVHVLLYQLAARRPSEMTHWCPDTQLSALIHSVLPRQLKREEGQESDGGEEAKTGGEPCETTPRLMFSKVRAQRLSAVRY